MNPGTARVDSKLRIGILCHPTYGGSGVVASELALSLADSGHDVHVFSHDVLCSAYSTVAACPLTASVRQSWSFV